MPRTYTRIPPYDRMIMKTVAGFNGCVVFTGCRRKGYGQVAIERGKPDKGAHVISFERWKGPVPPRVAGPPFVRQPGLCEP